MKKVFFVSLFTTVLSLSLFAQEANKEVKYRRSSLAMVLVDAGKFEAKDTVLQVWNDYPFPDKYDKHDITLKDIVLDGEELDLSKTQKAAEEGRISLDDLKNISGLAFGKKDVKAAIDSVIVGQHLGRQLVGRWFNFDGSKFDTDLIQQRGFYNASDLDVETAKASARGVGALGDAGEELLNNTFVSFTQFSFYNNEVYATIVKGVAYITASKLPNAFAQMGARKAADVLYEKTKDGKTLISKTFLYKLVWNDSIAAEFYNNWNNPADFEQMDFALEFVGEQSNQSIVLFTSNPIAAIKKAEVNNVDKVFAELQKKYDVFKPKVPVLTIDPLTAQIGKKEGLEGGEKFEILEITQDIETGRTKYVQVGTTNVDKKLIWDNRYNGGEAPESEVKDKDGNPISVTYFKQNKKAQPGMLLKQIK
jgi:hypothetical protein